MLWEFLPYRSYRRFHKEADQRQAVNFARVLVTNVFLALTHHPELMYYFQ